MNGELIARAVEVVANAVEEHRPKKVYALVSGGNDSSVMSHLVTTYTDLVDAYVHINTGIGIEETREWVRWWAETMGKPLIEKHPPVSYEEIVREHGFPGPGGHRFMYIRLKERALREVKREAQEKRGDRVMFLTGVRLQESVRRMGHVEPVMREGGTVWVAPILNFSTRDMLDYRREHDLPTNEVTAKLHMSGECLCGSFAREHELDEIRFWYPETAKRIETLQEQVKVLGIKACVWGKRPPLTLFGQPITPESDIGIISVPGMLCSDCVEA